VSLSAWFSAALDAAHAEALAEDDERSPYDGDFEACDPVRFAEEAAAEAAQEAYADAEEGSQAAAMAHANDVYRRTLDGLRARVDQFEVSGFGRALREEMFRRGIFTCDLDPGYPAAYRAVLDRLQEDALVEDALREESARVLPPAAEVARERFGAILDSPSDPLPDVDTSDVDTLGPAAMPTVSEVRAAMNGKRVTVILAPALLVEESLQEIAASSGVDIVKVRATYNRIMAEATGEAY
jgi:hypothetical protein